MQTRRTFYVTIVAGLVGFLIIAGSIISVMLKIIDIDFAKISTALGTIVEFITAFFFYLYNKTIRQLRDYQNDLLDSQNNFLAFKIIEDTLEGEDKRMMKHKFLEVITGMRPKYKPSYGPGNTLSNIPPITESSAQ